MTTEPTTTAGPHDLSAAQLGYLLDGLNPGRIRQTQGNSYLEGWDVRRALTVTFGIGGWDAETLELKCTREHGQQSGNGKARWWITYRAQVRLTVKAPDGRRIASWEDASSGEAANQPSHGDAHDLAMKTALTGALKRCAVNLGDQFGLSLYRDGSAKPVVIRSLAHTKKSVKAEADPGPGVADAPAVPGEVPNSEPAPEPAAQTPEPPARQETPEPEPAESVEEWKERVRQGLPTADRQALAEFESEVKAYLKAAQIDPATANNMMRTINKAKAALKKEGGARDAA